MSLIDELGLEYFNERFAGSMFFDKDKNVCTVATNKFIKNHVHAKVWEGPNERPTVKDHSVPWNFFTDLSVFKTPPLGWSMSADGTYLAHFSRNNRAYHRGTSAKILFRRLSPASQFLADTGNVNHEMYMDTGVTTKMVMTPVYVPFREGLEKMRKGELFSFAVSPTIAVIPDVYEQQALYCNTNKIGVVKPDGTIVCDKTVFPFIEDQL